MMSLDRLPPLLKAAVERQLASSEAVLGVAYLASFRDPPNVRSYGRSAGRRPEPGRALIVCRERVLVLDDPEDSATTSAARQYVAASSSIDAMVAIELRSHLLDCAITFVLASPDGMQRVTIVYNGVNEPSVLAALSLIRTSLDSHRRSTAAGPGAAPTEQVGAASHAAAKASHRQRYYLRKYLAPNEQVRSFLSFPALRRGHLLQRLTLLAHEQPAMLLARTDQQVLLVKNAPRALRRQTSYGCDAWIMPLRSLHSAEVRQGQPESTIVFGLGRSRVCYHVEFSIPASLTGEAAAFAREIHNSRVR